MPDSLGGWRFDGAARSVESVYGLWQAEALPSTAERCVVGRVQGQDRRVRRDRGDAHKAANMESADIPRERTTATSCTLASCTSSRCWTWCKRSRSTHRPLSQASPVIDQLYELIQLVTWLHNSAVRRLPLEDLEARLTAQLMHLTTVHLVRVRAGLQVAETAVRRRGSGDSAWRRKRLQFCCRRRHGDHLPADAASESGGSSITRAGASGSRVRATLSSGV